MRCYHWALAAILVSPASINIAGADEPPKPRCSWEEQDAKVLMFSSDGKSVVSSGRDGARLRDATTGQVRAVLSSRPTGEIRKHVFSPDSRLLFAQVMSDRSLPLIVHDVKVWDVASGQPRDTFPYVAEYLDENSFELSGDGRFLAFVDNSERLPVQVKTHTLLMDGHRKVNASHNTHPTLPRVKIWDVAKWKEVAVVDGGLPLAFSRDGTTLVTGDREWKTPVAKVWDTATGQLRTELKDRSPGLSPITISPDGKLLAASSHSDSALWSLADGRRLAIQSGGAGHDGPVFSADGKLLFPRGLSPRLWPVYPQHDRPCYDLSEMPPRRLNLGDGVLIFSPDARQFAAVGATTGPEDRTIVMNDLPDRRETGRSTVSGFLAGRFSPDGRWLALLVANHVMNAAGSASQYVHEIRLLDPATLVVRATIATPAPLSVTPGVVLSPDGKSLALWYFRETKVLLDAPSDRLGTIEIWDLPPL